MNYPRAQFRIKELFSKHESKLQNILTEGERYCLSYALNLSRGGRLVSLADQKDDRLLGLFDKLSLYSKSFFYGRYDIKCNSIEELKQGKNFSILEFNGAGAEPNHIYDCNMSIWKAYGTILKHWKALYRISRYNHKQGVPYWSFQKGRRFIKEANKHFRLLEKFD
jgi:hypothetical protein